MSVPDLGEFRLGDWQVNQAEGTLLLDGHCVRLEPRVMDVLVALAAAPGKLVSKEDLLQQVWGGTFVEEGVLSQAVHTLRKALGDDARQPRYIQTTPKRGYRLVAQVAAPQVEVPKKAGENPPAEIETPAPLPPPGHGRPAMLEVSHRARLLLFALIILAATASWIAWKRSGKPSAPQPIKIVVLPFENRGTPDGDDAYLADGLTDEIASDLGLISSFQVISQQTSTQYKGTRKTTPEITRELKVNYILKGTIEWGSDLAGRPRVRVRAELIRTADDIQVWAQTFEEQVEDILAAEEKLSREVIGQLNVIPQKSEEQALRERPTDNMDAYRAYARGLEIRSQPFYSEKAVRGAIPLFERAVSLDPRFAEAWAELSQTQSYLALNGERSAAQIESARSAMKQAVALDPDLPAVYLAQIYYTYRCQEDFDAAYRMASAAASRFPNESEILQALGFILRRKGELPEAIQVLEHAFSLNPRTYKLVWAIGETYRALRKYAQADDYYARAIALAPDQAKYWEERALNRLDWTGNIARARQILLAAPETCRTDLIPIELYLDLYERNYGHALARLSGNNWKELAHPYPSELATLQVVALDKLGRNGEALAQAATNRAILEERVKNFPRDPFYRAYWALALSRLGRGAEARMQVEEAVRLDRKDLFSGPRIVKIQAAVYENLGRTDEAIDLLRQLRSKFYQSPLSDTELRLSPVWDRLRSATEFQSLLDRRGT